MMMACGPGEDRLPGMPLSDRAALQFEVEQFLYREAAMLDERRFDEWLDLLAEDIHYWMPIRRTTLLKDRDKEFTRLGDMAYFDDDKQILGMRVAKLTAGSAWSEDPPSRTRHFVSNVCMRSMIEDCLTLDVNFHLYRTRLESEVDSWVGRREDKLIRQDTGWLIRQRHIFLDQTVIRSTNFSSIF